MENRAIQANPSCRILLSEILICMPSQLGKVSHCRFLTLTSLLSLCQYLYGTCTCPNYLLLLGFIHGNMIINLPLIRETGGIPLALDSFKLDLVIEIQVM